MVTARQVQACDVCGRTVIGGTVRDLRVHYQYECSGAREREREESTMETRKRIRWTITGVEAPLDSRAQTWDVVCLLVRKAEELGLRVEVAELDEEER